MKTVVPFVGTSDTIAWKLSAESPSNRVRQDFAAPDGPLSWTRWGECDHRSRDRCAWGYGRRGTNDTFGCRGENSRGFDYDDGIGPVPPPDEDWWTCIWIHATIGIDPVSLFSCKTTRRGWGWFWRRDKTSRLVVFSAAQKSSRLEPKRTPPRRRIV